VDLFESAEGVLRNYLPENGCVNYLEKVLSTTEANEYFENLLNRIAWENDKVLVFGKNITTKRKVAWYGDQAFAYTYSQVTKIARPWTKELSELKAIAEQESGESFNACLLNLYHDGAEGMAWHSDNEKDLKKNGAIASLSFGAERKFCFKHKQSQQQVSLYLQNGSLLIMKGETQRYWLHCLPTSTSVTSPRINLTFRTIV